MKIILILFMAISLFGSDYSSMEESFEDGDINRAIAYARNNATNGNVAAMYDLGLLYNSKGDTKKAKRWFESSVKQGGKGALGIALILFTEENYAKALDTLNGVSSGDIRNSLMNVSEDLQDNGDSASSYDYFLIGQLFYADKMVNPNPQLAIFLLDKAAKKGNKNAQEIMGDAYNNTVTAPLVAARPSNTLDIALGYYKQASAKGNFDAMAKMGYLYLVGPRNIRNGQYGVKIILQAADAGSAIGAKMAGDLYMNGQAIRADYNKALDWYKRATDVCDANDELSTAQDYARYYASCSKDFSITQGYSFNFEEF